MKVLFAVAVTIVLGLAAGVGTAFFQLGLAPWDGDPGGQDPSENLPADEPTPRVEVDSEEHDFGKMDFEDEGSHDFIFTNTGDATLSVKVGETTCRCTGAKAEDPDILPGQSGKVTVNWTADDDVGPFRVRVTISTNDPRRKRLELTVTGQITAITRFVPPRVVFTGVSAGLSVAAEARLYGYLDQPLEILDWELSDPATAEHFDITLQPLSSDQLDEEPEARSGYLVKVAVKPGLPVGLFQQTILIRTNLPAAAEVEIPVTGTIVSDITVWGQGWDSRTGVLGLGVVRADQGAQRTLLLMVRGPHRQQVQFRHVASTPKVLGVALGEKTAIGDGAVYQTKLLIQIPKGSRPVNRLGSEQGGLGEILIDTNHPQVPRLRIPVRFAIEG